MDSSTFDRMTRLFGSPARRRTALAATAATGLAALTAGTSSAQKTDDELSAEARRRGRRGPRGKRGKPGPPAGARIRSVSVVCPIAAGATTVTCLAPCPSGMVASGGGFLLGPILVDLDIVRQSRPILAGNQPTGWEVVVEDAPFTTAATFTAYALCLPT